MNENIIYLDNAATTKPSQEAVKAFLKASEAFGNPSSLHGLGLEAEKLVEESRRNIAEKLGVDAKNILFTSGGTEANNTAIFGVANARHKIGKRLITSKIEHPSVLEAFRHLESEGFDVVYIGVDSDGVLDLDMLADSLNKETTLVSIMHVNNETGVIQPIEKIKEIMLEKAPYAHLHTDCVQSFGKIDVKPKKLGADLVTISSHKIHGFKGTGALYVSDMRMIRPMIFGGEQQNEMRPGKENVAGILAFGAAAKEITGDNSNLVTLRNLMEEKLSVIPDIKINGSYEYNSGSILNVSFVGIKAEILLHALEAKKVYVSTGSACSSHKPQPSHVLGAMNLNKKEIEGAIRISFDNCNTEEEIITAAEIIEKEVAAIRRYM
ncbi:MAG: cysteine desulfurase [Clostridia bacterium]|nr:cysteine desulfurase [Clostridia bacterium]